MTGDVNAMGDLFSQSLGEMVQAALLSLGMTVVLLVIDPVLALVSLATAPLMAVLSYVYRRRVRTQSRRAARAGGPDRLGRVGGAVGDVGRQGVRLGGLRERAACARAASGGSPPASQVARLQARFDGLVGSVRGDQHRGSCS